MKSKNGKLKRLHKRHKRKCFYCGKKTILPESGVSTSGLKHDSATIEHIFNKLDVRRYLCKDTVLACYECNYGKAIKDYDAIFNNNEYRDCFYKDDEHGGIYRGLLLTIAKSSNPNKYLQ